MSFERFVTSKRIHMRFVDCQAYSNSKLGAWTLQNPTNAAKKHADSALNRTLYPRISRRRPEYSSNAGLFEQGHDDAFSSTSGRSQNEPSRLSMSTGKRKRSTHEDSFVAASDVMSERLSVDRGRKGIRGKRKNLPVQSNTMDKYFKPVPRTNAQTSSVVGTASSNRRTSFSNPTPQSVHSINNADEGPSQLDMCQADVKPSQLDMYQSDVKPSQLDMYQSDVKPSQLDMYQSDVKPSQLDMYQSDVKPSQLDMYQSDVKPSQLDRYQSDVKPSQLNMYQADEGPSQLNVYQSDVKPSQLDMYQVDEKLPQVHTNVVDQTPSQTIHTSSHVEDPPDSYGLLGTGRMEFDTVNYFARLPVEVIENIFCHLSVVDLCLTLTCVCKHWKEIISRPQFLQWRKTYLCIVHGVHNKKSELCGIMSENGINPSNPDSALLQLIRHMKDFRPLAIQDMTQYLSKHALYPQALEVMKRLPGCFHDQEPNCWSAVACLVILSKSVRDVQNIVRCLTLSRCTIIEITECLYCIASFLWIFKDISYNEAWTGIHYRLYYALYLFENDSVVTCKSLKNVFSESSGQQSIVRYGLDETKCRYTHEQLRICNHSLKAGEIIKIVAFAGTGKTTTLIRYTQIRPSLSFLLLVYNKSAQQYCARHFPDNVTCKTMHSLAKSSKICRKYFGKKIGNLHVGDLVKVLPHRKKMNLYEEAQFVIRTIKSFLSSADRKLTLAHVPLQRINDNGLPEYVGIDERELILEDAIRIWLLAKDPNNLSVKLSHDGYLKLYQLSKPSIRGYDVILVDEAQDLTPAVIDIIINQTQPKIIVGDPHQQIYSFRGAKNALDILPSITTYYLTQSFRFGPQIAYVANCCLALLKNVHKKILVGNNSPDKVDGSCCGQVAIITRTNFKLFAEAVNKCCYSNKQERIAFAGGVDSFGFDMILDIYVLSLPPQDRAQYRITHSLVKAFDNICDFEKFAKRTGDYDLLGKIKIVHTYGYQLPSLISQLKAKTVSDIDFADIVLSTAHKSKGLEFNTVQVANDFITEFLEDGGEQDELTDEHNLLYVAVTRAKKSLVLSPILKDVLYRSGGKAAEGLQARLSAACL